jgi:hypothetical protein
MSRIELDSELLDHPKLFRLMTRLHVKKTEAVGTLAHMWLWCRKHRPDGNLGGLNDAEIALAACWLGDSKLLVTALKEPFGNEAGFLETRDGSLWVHDLDDFIPEIERKKLRRQTDVGQTSDKRPTNGGSVQSSSPVVMSFPVSGEPKTWELREEHLEKLGELYPGINAREICKRALFWVENNPKKKKTAKRMLQWLASVWCEKDQNRHHPKTSTDKDAEFDAEMKRVKANREKSDAMVKAYAGK